MKKRIRRQEIVLRRLSREISAVSLASTIKKSSRKLGERVAGERQASGCERFVLCRGAARGFTLMELLVSVALFIVAISIALFATIGSNSLVQRVDSRSVISESGRNISDQLRRVVVNAPVGGVQLTNQYNQGDVYAVVRVKSFSSDQARVVCESIGRAVVVDDGGEQLYRPSVQGDLLAYWIHQVDSRLNCPDISSPSLFQNRLTDPASLVTDFKLHIRRIDCQPPSSTCVIKQHLRYSLTVKTKRKEIGRAAETARASITINSGIAIGLINENLLPLNIETSMMPESVVGTDYGPVQLFATGGIPPYNWSLDSGSSLPLGLSLSQGGIISGRPSQAGTFYFVVRVTDSVGGTANKTLSIIINQRGGGNNGGAGGGDNEGGIGGSGNPGSPAVPLPPDPPIGL